MKYIPILLLLTACFSTSDQLVVQTLSPRKQKQKIAHLQKKLELAEKEKKEIESEVERLASEIDQAKLVLIRRQIDKHENEKLPSLFLDEREALYQMIQTGPSPSAFEAQDELDRILRLITEFSDEEKRV